MMVDRMMVDRNKLLQILKDNPLSVLKYMLQNDLNLSEEQIIAIIFYLKVLENMPGQIQDIINDIRKRSENERGNDKAY